MPQDTGHIEVARVEFDPAVLSYGDLLRVCQRDPTTPGRQGNDVSVRNTSPRFSGRTNPARTGPGHHRRGRRRKYDAPCVTKLLAPATFWPAEDYHRNYFELHPEQGYCQFVIAPGGEVPGAIPGSPAALSRWRAPVPPSGEKTSPLGEGFQGRLYRRRRRKKRVLSTVFSTPRRIWSSSIDSNRGLEVTFAEAVVALALDDLEEDRADLVLGEDLQQQAAAGAPSAECAFLCRRDVFAVVRQAAVQQLVWVSGVSRNRTVLAQRFDRAVDIVGRHGDMLDAFAAVQVRYSWIWPFSSVPSSLMGMRILPHGEVMAQDFTPVTLPSMSKWRTSRKLNRRS